MREPFDSMAEAGFSEACERNKDFILKVLKKTFTNGTTILEIGSGTGQHVVYFSRQLPMLNWQPTDTSEYLDGLRQRLSAEAPDNVEAPIELDVRMQPWPVGCFDGVFSANTLHFMSWSCAEQFFRGVGESLANRGVLCVYGPFRYDGEFTSDSNARFDKHLKQMDAQKGIRDFEAINELAKSAKLEFIQDVPMPANNQILVWKRQ
jgi:cyclopropane fatty-acyl-phospholipid synthase-like methyltransferase